MVVLKEEKENYIFYLQILIIVYPMLNVTTFLVVFEVLIETLI